MRPVPSSKHILSIVIITVISLLSGYVAFQKDTLTPEQENYAASAYKRHFPDSMPYDSLFGKINAKGRLPQMNTPVFTALLEMSLIPTDYKDPTLPYKIGVIPFTFIFLCGMYSLLWQLCRSSTIACYTAVLSMTVIRTLGDWSWGIGTLESITPAGIVVAFAPIVLISYLQNKNRLQVVISFMAIGVLGNISFIAAFNFMLGLLAVQFWNTGFKPKALIRAACCVGAYLIGCLPYILYFISLKSSIAASTPDQIIPAKIVICALQTSNSELLSTRIFEELLNLSIYFAILVILSALFLWKTRKFKPHGAGNWITFSAATCGVGLLFHALSLLYAKIFHTTPPVVAFIQASSWVLLGLYILFALGLTHLFRMVRRSRPIVRWGLTIFMLLWMVPSANLQFFRHQVYQQVANLVLEDKQPIRLQEIQERKIKQEEYIQIATWARSKENVPKESIFLSNSPAFRIYSGRSLLVCQDDILYFYYLSPWLLKDWTQLLFKQSRCLAGNMTQIEALSWISKIANRSQYNQISNWYMIIPSRNVATWKNPDQKGIQEVKNERWGKYWRVFKIQFEEVSKIPSLYRSPKIKAALSKPPKLNS